MSEFARVAAGPCADHSALATLVAAELGQSPGPRLEGRLTGLARQLSRGVPEDELRGLGVLLARRFRPDGRGALLLPEALETGLAHAATVAVIGAGIAGRAGLRIGLVGNGRRLYLAHERESAPSVLDPAAPGSPVDARRLGVDLYWRCAHESAGALLDHVMERAGRGLDLATVETCTMLRRTLALVPSCDPD